MGKRRLCDHGQDVRGGCYQCGQETEATEECNAENVRPDDFAGPD